MPGSMDHSGKVRALGALTRAKEPAKSCSSLQQTIAESHEGLDRNALFFRIVHTKLPVAKNGRNQMESPKYACGMRSARSWNILLNFVRKIAFVPAGVHR